MRAGRMLAAGLACLFVAGCASGRPDSAPSLGGDSGRPTPAPCNGVKLDATDIGITADTITVETVADVGSPVVPGLANGSHEAARAWAAMLNKTDGLACRQIEVRTFDSKLEPGETRSGMVDSCQNAFAMVGDAMLAAADVTPIAECVDAKSATTGLPHITGIAAGSAVSCNATTYLAMGGQSSCPPSQGTRTFSVSTATGEYVRDLIGGDGTGFYMSAGGTPSILEGTVPPIQQMRNQQGLPGPLVGVQGNDTQATYTAIVKQLQQSGATFVYSTPAFPAFVLLQSEAKAQGVTVPHWICYHTCYDPAYVKAAGDLAHNVNVVTNTLPFEEATSNREMGVLTEKVKTHNLFSRNTWVAARLFQKAVEDVVARDGPNALTRRTLLAALDAVRDFDAGGIMGPITPSEQKPSRCVVIMRVNGGRFERAFPKEAGTLHCGRIESVTLDPVKTYSTG
jgi:hypothetical protein